MARMTARTTRIRDYGAGDAPAIVRLFFDTVRKVNREDYSEEQVEAWAPGVPDPEEWHTRMNGRRTLVAEEEGGWSASPSWRTTGTSTCSTCARTPSAGAWAGASTRPPCGRHAVKV